MSNVKVTLAYPYTDADGKDHRPDTTLSLPEGEARRLLHFGRARTPDASTPAKSAPKE